MDETTAQADTKPDGYVTAEPGHQCYDCGAPATVWYLDGDPDEFFCDRHRPWVTAALERAVVEAAVRAADARDHFMALQMMNAPMRTMRLDPAPVTDEPMRFYMQASGAMSAADEGLRKAVNALRAHRAGRSASPARLLTLTNPTRKP